MGTEILNLQHELDQAKNSLKNVDEHLKKLIGRDPSELPPRLNKRPVFEDKVRPGIKNFSRGKGFNFENDEPPNKRRNTSVFNRLSDKVLETPQKGLISKVIVTPKEIPSREAALQAQNKDEKFKARNRRMFGALLGTLQKFQQEETKLKSREEKRAQLEKKIEDHEIKEKEEIRKERQELFLNRKKKQAEIKIIELKMLRMKEYNAWEETQKPRRNFIRTKSKPQIHFLPHKLNDKTKELLASSKSEIDELIEAKRQQITDELQHIADRLKRNFENRIIRPDNNESGEHEVQDTEGHLEDSLTESQLPNEISENVHTETKEEHWNNEKGENESSESTVENNTVDKTNSGINDTCEEPENVQFEDTSFNEVQNQPSSDETIEAGEIVNENSNGEKNI